MKTIPTAAAKGTVVAMNNLQDNLRLLDMIHDNDEREFDAVEMAWMDDESLLNHALDYDKIKDMSNDDLHSLVYELAKRLDDYRNEDPLGDRD